MEIIFKKQFLKEIVKLPAKVQMAIKDIIYLLEKSDNIQGLGIDIKRMEGQRSYENYYRIRVGSYRIGIEIINPKIIIITVLAVILDKDTAKQ